MAMTEAQIIEKTAPGHMGVYFGTVQIHDKNCHVESQLEFAVEGAKKAWTEISKHHQKRMQDTSITESARLKSSAQYARKTVEEIDRKINTARQDAEAMGQKISQDMRGHLEPPGSSGMGLIHQEVRAYVRGLPDAERTAFVNSASGQTLKALITAPCELSGLTTPTHERLRAAYFEAAAPGQAKKLQALDKHLNTLDRASGKLREYTNALVDFQSAARIERLSA